MDDFDENKLFPIQNDEATLATGICADGRQVMMGLICPQLVAYFFDRDGEIIGGERQQWNHPAPSMGEDGPYQIYDLAFRVAIAEQMKDWQTKLGFKQSKIEIQDFFDDELYVGITLIPDHLELEEIEKTDDLEERKYFEEDRENWLANGNFVWWWCEEYWMSKEGKIEST